MSLTKDSVRLVNTPTVIAYNLKLIAHTPFVIADTVN